MKWHGFLLAILAAAAVAAPEKKREPKAPAPAPPPLAAGQEAPAFSLPAFPGGKARLKDYRGKWLVLCFYPKANAPKDIAQMASLKNAWPRIEKLNGTVLGVSMDPPNVAEKFQRDLALPFPLAVDEKKEASAAYGALGLKGLFSTRRAVFVNPEGKVAGFLDKCAESEYGDKVADRLKALQGS